MKYRFWWCVWSAMALLQALCLVGSGAMAWFARRVNRGADAAEIEMLLARTERALRSKSRRGGPQR